jgi:hypothetical protein
MHGICILRRLLHMFPWVQLEIEHKSLGIAYCNIAMTKKPFKMWINKTCGEK